MMHMGTRCWDALPEAGWHGYWHAGTVYALRVWLGDTGTTITCAYHQGERWREEAWCCLPLAVRKRAKRRQKDLQWFPL